MTFHTESGDVKASIAALSYILTSAAKYSVDGESLSNELQQLGLPKGDIMISNIMTYINVGCVSFSIYCRNDCLHHFRNEAHVDI